MNPNADELLDISNLLSNFASGRWSPGDVIEAVLERISHCTDRAIFIDLLPRAAIDAQIDRLKNRSPRDCPLFGVPFAVKDNIDVAGRPTTAGCPAFTYQPGQSATVVQKLCDAGAILVGKTNLDQFATGLVGVRSPYGPCVNPFDSRYISGGSSSGSAVAVARGLVSFALGTDTAGSGRVPAAFNNVVGLKPSRGLLSTAGIVPACRSLDCVSIFALTCQDAWRVSQCAIGFDSTDPYSRRLEDIASPSRPAARRFGIPKAEQLNFFGNTQYQSLYQAAISRMRSLGASETTIDCQPLFDAGRLLYDGPWLAERYSGLRDFLAAHPDGVLPVIRTILEGGARYDGVACFEGLHKLAGLYQKTQEIWDQIDLLLLPTAGTIYSLDEVAADPIALNKNLGRYTSFANLLDLCAVAVPAGFTKDGLPMGVGLVAPAGRDGYLVELAAALHRLAGLKAGAPGHAMPAERAAPIPQISTTNEILLAVVGAHLSGQPLNGQLTTRGGRLARTCRTAPSYRLHALSGTQPPKPGLVYTTNVGAAIEVEVWAMDAESFGSFVAEVPPPMVIGTLRLEDGTSVKGFLCEPYALTGSVDITSFGGWRAYLIGR